MRQGDPGHRSWHLVRAVGVMRKGPMSARTVEQMVEVLKATRREGAAKDVKMLARMGRARNAGVAVQVLAGTMSCRNAEMGLRNGWTSCNDDSGSVMRLTYNGWPEWHGLEYAAK